MRSPGCNNDDVDEIRAQKVLKSLSTPCENHQVCSAACELPNLTLGCASLVKYVTQSVSAALRYIRLGCAFNRTKKIKKLRPALQMKLFLIELDKKINAVQKTE